MPTIGPMEIAAVYELAREVAEGKCTEAQAVRDAHDQFGMNKSSALAYIRNRAQLLKGEPYHRTMNIGATRYFLENIYRDVGVGGLRRALNSVREHANYYKAQGKSGLPSIMALVHELEQEHFSDNSDDEWDRQVVLSYKLPEQDRRKQLPLRGHKPQKIQSLTTTYIRNPHVVAERLRIANGKCENCQSDAPFIRKADGLPYLEVHHRITLANGGDDTVENAIALCPNCHRQAHYG